MPNGSPQTSATDIQAIAESYARKSVSEARDEIGPLTDQVAYQHKRLVLTKQGRPMAVLVPVGDLVTLHALDAQRYAAMRRAADRHGADEEPGMSLLTPPSPADRQAVEAALEAAGAAKDTGADDDRQRQATRLQELLLGAILPSLLGAIEQRVIDGVMQKLQGRTLPQRADSTLRESIAEGVHESLERPTREAVAEKA